MSQFSKKISAKLYNIPIDKKLAKKYTTINENVLAKLQSRLPNVLVILKTFERTFSQIITMILETQDKGRGGMKRQHGSGAENQRA